jgi:deferrochelatase/peroxidase EfeB
MPVAVDRTNVQGLIVNLYPYPLARHFLFRLGDAAAARRFLGEWVPRTTSAAVDLGPRPEPLINLALTWGGLRRLGALEVPAGVPAAEADFPWDFREPPDAVSMGDADESAPEHWWNGRFTSEDVHLVLHVFCRTEPGLTAVTAEVRASAGRHEIEELVPTDDGVEALTGRSLPAQRQLHFGYKDGISHPPVNWDDAPGRSDLVDLRHFLLGYRTPEVESAPSRGPWSDFVRDGCYAVFRWIRQDVAAFNRLLRDAAPVVAPDLPQAEAEELLAAKLMGRWRNGAPLVLSPDRPDEALALANDFGYAREDPQGHRCPFAAHVRIAYVRDQPLSPANEAMFREPLPGPPRLLRRGLPYGPELQGFVDDGVDRGVMGVFLCANINMQFYSVMRWMNKTDFSPVFDWRSVRRQDPLVGNRDVCDAKDGFPIPRPEGPPMLLTGLPQLVRTRGVLCTLLPSLRTLRALTGNA